MRRPFVRNKYGWFIQIALLLALFTMVLTACGGSNSNTGGTNGNSTLKVALVTDVGGLNDNGFNHLSYVGYTKAKSELGFQERVIQSQSQNDYVSNLTQAAQAADLVFAVGFLMDGAIYQVAKKFPAKKFAIIDGCATAPNSFDCTSLPNVAPISFKEQEAGCLVGALAAQMELDGKSKIPQLSGSNTISAVGGQEIPPVVHYIAGYKYCAQKVNPSIKVLVGYSQDFAATAKCKDLALSQINQNKSDIVFQVAGGCGVGALDAANQKGVFGIGVDADQGYLHKSVITSAMKRVDTSVYSTIVDFSKNKFSNNPAVFDLQHDGVGYAPTSSDVPADAKAKADEFATMIKSGSLVPPATIPA
ncbi:BMP family lipoprotein [Ktedonospora formicarum]|uniref:BMP family ABC transporter substrate-binding protein n=1 Tax=Ktedonospora formicarum TaxID=2778364 RepID=A0A8J3I0D8_9CHLR|nr:BMP family ABC transporter substrate-binding protein [Ktedonospora formicarum]GHO44363.1 BMP family ABC transporter substrate-binding protein [Ktedonospora formicarum]